MRFALWLLVVTLGPGRWTDTELRFADPEGCDRAAAVLVEELAEGRIDASGACVPDGLMPWTERV